LKQFNEKSIICRLVVNLLFKLSNFIFILFIISCSSFFKEPGRPPKVDGIPLPDNFRKIYIQNFQNNSYGPGIHTLLTQALKAEFDRRGRFIQTRNKGDAKFKLYGSINHYQKIGNLLDFGDQQISAEITVVAKIEIQETNGDRIPLERDEIMVRAYYSDQVGFKESEEQAQSRLMNSLAYRISEESENAWYFYIKQKYYSNKKIEKKE
jgi:hypothetical protein